MTEAATKLPEERVFGVLNSVMALAIAGLTAWYVVDPGGSLEWIKSTRERWRQWKADQAALTATLDEIRDLPEADTPEEPA